MKKVKVTKKQQEVLEGLKESRHFFRIGRRSLEYKKYALHREVNLGENVDISTQDCNSLIKKGMLVKLWEGNIPRQCLVLTDVARAQLNEQSLQDFNDQRFVKARELLSAPKTRESFQKIVDLLTYSERSTEWCMLFDYVEQQLEDWPDDQRMYDFHPSLLVVPQEAHKLTRVRFINCKMLLQEYSCFENATDHVFIDAHDIRDSLLNNLIYRSGKSWKHIEIRQGRHFGVLGGMTRLPMGFFEHLESFTMLKSKHRRTVLLLAAQAMLDLEELFSLDAIKPIVTKKLKLIDLSQTAFEVSSANAITDVITSYLETLADEHKPPTLMTAPKGTYSVAS